MHDPRDRVHRHISNAARFDRIVAVTCLTLLAAIVAYPTLRMAIRAVVLWEWSVFYWAGDRRAIVNTVMVSFASVASAGVTGTSLAFFVSRVEFPLRRMLAAVAYLPFALPPLVGVLSFYYLAGRYGFLPRIIGRVLGVEGVFLKGFTGILAVHTYSFYVFFYAMVSSALQGMDRGPIEAARTLGASRLRVFTRVMLPLLRPALLGASVLTFMSSAASFSAPLFFGEDYPMLSVRIVQAREQFSHGETYTLTVILAAVALLGLFVFRGRERSGTGASKGVPVPVRSQRARLAMGGLGALLIVMLVAPHATILWLSFVDHARWYEEVIPRVHTLSNYAGVLRDSQSLRPIVNSLWMSAAGTAAALALALPAAYLIGRRRPGALAVNLLAMTPWALPGTVIAMNLIAAFNDPWLPLYGTAMMIPLAYCVRNLPLLTRMVAAVVEPFDASLIEAGRTLGASPLYCFHRIVVPLILPAIAAGAALVFASSLGEFVASVLLYLPSNVPISVEIAMRWRGSGIGAAFAYSVFLMGLATATFAVARRFAFRPA